MFLTSRYLRRCMLPTSITHRSIYTKSHFFRVSEEVQQAIVEHRPVVALETTIYTHGFPYPDNVSLAIDLEALVRANGAIPATIGILDGVAHVGLNSNELIRIVSSAGQKSTLKVSRRDLGFALGLKDLQSKPFNGGTTVSGTALLAHLAGIKIFATGGLGGVHRGVEETMDVSADLTELGRTPVAVISSGCKSFLDIPRTIEYLETQGVAVATFADGRPGQVDFPAFYSRDSGTKSPMTVQNELDAANVIHAHLSLGLSSGLLFANPIPEKYSIPLPQMEINILQALEEARNAGTTGAAATPYILAKIKELTGHKSIDANRALIEANVLRGTAIASLLSKLEAEGLSEIAHNPINRGSWVTAAANQSKLAYEELQDSETERIIVDTENAAVQKTSIDEEPKPSLFVAGSLALDLACDYVPRTEPGSKANTGVPLLHTSNPARISQSLGGVGSNVARAAHLMGAQVRLCSAIGDDLAGRAAVEALRMAGLPSTGVKIFGAENDLRTAQYIAVNDIKKDLHLAVADMSIFESKPDGNDVLSTSFDDFWLPQVEQSRPSHLVVDANWSPHHLTRWFDAGRRIGAHVTFEPVSHTKSTALFKLPKDSTLSAFPNPTIHLATPNKYEMAAMHESARESGQFSRSDWWEVIDAFGIPHSGARVQLALASTSQLVDAGIPQQTLQLLPFIPTICVKLGAEGILLSQIIPANDTRLNSPEYNPYIISRCANGTEDSVGVGGVYMRLFPAAQTVEPEDIVSVNGVGDTFVGTLVAGLAKGGNNRIEDLIDIAQRAAVLTLKSAESVSSGLGTLKLLL